MDHWETLTMLIIKKYSIITFVICLFVMMELPVFAAPNLRGIDPRAQEILRKCAEKYASLKTYKDVTAFNVETDDGSQKQIDKSEQKVIFQASPLKLLVDYKASDPKDNTTTLITAEKYKIAQVRNTVPIVWEKELAGINFGRKVLLQRRPLSWTFTTLLAGINPLESPWQTAFSALTLRESTVVDGEPVFNIKATYTLFPKDSVTYLISKNDYLIRGIRGIIVDAKNVSTISIEMHRNIVVDTAIPESTFAPPILDQKFTYPLEVPVVNSVLKIGQQFPTIRGFDFKGDKFDLATYQGKVLLIYFWASWCPACREDIPYMITLYHKYHSQGLEIIGISEDIAGRSLQQYIDDANIPWINLYDIENKLKKKNGVPHIPYAILIDNTGNIHSFEKQGIELEAQIVTLLSIRNNVATKHNE